MLEELVFQLDKLHSVMYDIYVLLVILTSSVIGILAALLLKK